MSDDTKADIEFDDDFDEEICEDCDMPVDDCMCDEDGPTDDDDE